MSDHMVVQAGMPVRLWGWAGADEVVTARIGTGAPVTANANGAGKWQVFLPKLPAGGPYTITVNQRTIKDVLAGDVWVASGQSNMGFTLARSDGGPEEVKKAMYPRLRFFKISSGGYAAPGCRGDMGSADAGECG